MKDAPAAIAMMLENPTAIRRPVMETDAGLLVGFDRETWELVGGTGDPAAASVEEQDQRAAILLRQKGTSPWPVCGRKV